MTRPVYTDVAKIRVWLEGVEFPYVKSVSVSSSPSGSRCQLELPPSSKIKTEQWAGMMVHVFFATKDVLSFSSNSNPSDMGWYKGEGLDDKGWPILFQGEVVSDGMSESPSSESLTINAISHARHFTQTKLYFWDMKSANIDIQQQAYFVGNSKLNIDAPGALSKQSQILSTMLDRAKNITSDGERNIAFTSMILELLRSTGNQHAIFNHFNDKLRLTQRFGAFIDPDVKNILSLNQLAILVDQRAKTLSHSASIMDIIELCTDIMNYSWIHIPQPHLRKDGESKLIKDESNNEFTTDELETSESDSKKMVKEFFSLISETRLRIPTSQGAIDAPLDYFEKIQERQSLTLDNFISKMLAINLDDLQLAMNTMVKNYEYVTIGNLSKTVVKINSEGVNELAENVSLPGLGDDESGKTDPKDILNLMAIDQSKLEAQDELTEFIVTPDMFFAQPPKCNVIMPYSFSSAGIQRDFMSEPTRLYAQVSVLPSSSNSNTAITEWYIAPASQAFHKLSGDGALEPYTTEYAKFVKSIQTSGNLVSGEE